MKKAEAVEHKNQLKMKKAGAVEHKNQLRMNKAGAVEHKNQLHVKKARAVERKNQLDVLADCDSDISNVSLHIQSIVWYIEICVSIPTSYFRVQQR